MPQQQVNNPESGLRDHRVEFIREDDVGVTPSDPDIYKYSDTISEMSWSSDATNEPRRGIGDADPTDFIRGTETHEVTVVYDLVKWFEGLNDPDSSTELGVQSTDSSDTDVDVTITSEDGSTSETISTDGTDGTNFATGSTTFSTVGEIELGSETDGDIEVYTNDSGSAGTLVGTVSAGNTVVDNAGDASYDGMVRNADNLLPHSHTFLDREDKGEVAAENTVSGNTARSTRIYTVGRGGEIDEVTLTGDPSDSQPVTVELSYVFQKVRTYQIDQPDSSVLVVAESTDADDTNQTLTIEGEDDSGSYTTETLSLNGTTSVAGSTSFQSIDAAHLDSETVGDVKLHVNSGTEASPTTGDQLAEIAGSDTYNGVEGDLGVPGKGSNGSRETLSNPDPELFLGDVIERSGSPVPHEIQSMTVTVSNNIETTERAEGFGLSVFPANRNITAEVTMYGETTTHNILVDHLQNNQKDLTWEMDNGTLKLSSTSLTDPGERAAESGQAVMTTDNTFTATGLDIN